MNKGGETCYDDGPDTSDLTSDPALGVESAGIKRTLYRKEIDEQATALITSQALVSIFGKLLLPICTYGKDMLPMPS